jgi:ubiquinone/menaquinone biosynthesis C-methylase UbiE/glycosyltransferase involved in cell wall biosynthesis
MRDRPVRILVTCETRIPSVELGAIIPLTHLQEQGFCQIIYKDEEILSLADIAWCDVLFIVRGASTQSLWAADAAKKLQRKVLGYWDDDLLNIPSRYPLSYNYFSRTEIKENISRLFKITDFFFSPSPKLAAKLSAILKREVKVLPVVFGTEKLKPPSRKSHDVLIAGYMASPEHFQLLNSFLGPVLEAAVDKYINFNIHIVGPRPDFIDKLKDRTIYTSYIGNYYDYLDFASRLNWDIGLAPQVDDEFTTYKFYNKLLEYTSIGCAGIYSKLEPYTNVIQDGITGLLADNGIESWRDAVLRLLKDSELRFKIASNAYELVRSSHNRQVVAQKYATALGPFLSYRAPEIRKKNMFSVERYLYNSVVLRSKKEDKTEMLEWTGERYVPWMEEGEIHYEHLHRYRFAKEFVRNKKVLDLACGEGYGSFMLAEKAESVIGIDIDESTIRHASSKYIKENLEFIEGSITNVPIKGENIFDVVICFEALEHIEEHDKLMKEVKRLLTVAGIFIVSTPNKYTYTDQSNFQNPFHLKELYFDDFKDLLSNNFQHAYIYGQKIYPSSNIFPFFKGKTVSKEFVIEKRNKEFVFLPSGKKLARYFIAVASDSSLRRNLFLGNSYLLDISETLFPQKDAQISHLERVVREKKATLNQIYNSRGWKALVIYYKIRNKIFPTNTKRRLFASRFFAIVIRILLFTIHSIPKKISCLIMDFFEKLQGRDDLTPPRSMIFVGDGDFKEIGEKYKGYFLELGHLKPDDRVLDVGCGIGRMAVPLARFLSPQGEYWGFDIVKKGIKWCRSHIVPKCPNFHFLHCDVYNKVYNPNGIIHAKNYKFPFETNSFDFVFLTSVFTHMLPPDMEHYLSEISRVMKPEGRCLITFFLMTEEARYLIDCGSSTQNFKYEIDGCWTINENAPEAAIAYDQEFILQLFAKYDLKINKPIHYGSWCGRTSFLIGQDIIVATKRGNDRA